MFNKYIRYFRNLKRFDLLAFIVVLAGVNVIDIYEFFSAENQAPPIWKVLIAAFCIFALILVTGSRRGFREVYEFYEQSEEEAKFFQHWYSRNGDLHMFCTDLEWLEDERYEGVVRVLKTKSLNNRLFLYLKKYDYMIVDDLVNRGATLFRVKSEIKSEHRFSININEADYSVIIRNKKRERDKITVEEYINHRAMAYLGLDMLNDCYDDAAAA